MLLIRGIIEFQSTDASAGHKEESDILDILYLLLVGILRQVGWCEQRDANAENRSLTLKIFKISKLLR